MEVSSWLDDGDGDGQLERTAGRIIRILSQVAECLDEDEIEDMNAIVLEILELSKQKDTETKEMLIEYYIGFMELVEFCSGISGELIQQAIRSFLLIEQDEEGLGKLVYDMYMEMILVEYPSSAIDMNLKPDLMRVYRRLLTEGFEEICHIRLMVVGMFGVGKTTLIRRLCNQSIDDVESTVGINIFPYSCEINDDGEWEINTNDDQERFYSERLQVLVNKYGKRTDFKNTDSSFSKSEPSTMTTNATTNSPSTPTLLEYETEKDAFRMKVMKNRQEDDKSFYREFERAAKEKKILRRKPTVSVWDFAGQFVYYSTHHFFHNARSTYLVVLDISKKLSDKVEERNPLLESTTEGYTFHDAFKFWMKSIYIYTQQKKRMTAMSDHGRIQYPTYKPTIILIGTHKDKLAPEDLMGQTHDEYADNYFFEALKCFIDTPIMELVHRKTFVISKYDEADVYLNIKKEILKIAKLSPFWREKVPASFILLEKAVKDRKNRGETLMYFKDLERANECADHPVQQTEDIKVFLAFQTAFGNVIYYEQSYVDQMIILNPQWLIDIFKIFLTHKMYKKPTQLEQWVAFYQYGKLNRDIITELLEEKGLSDMACYIVRCMEYLNVMVRPVVEIEASENACISERRMTNPFSQMYCSDKQVVEDFYIMPCLLPPRPTDEELVEIFATGKSLQPPTLCMHIGRCFFLPPFVFHCIIATTLKKLPIAVVKGSQIMFSALAGFSLNRDRTRILLIWCRDDFLCVNIIFKDKTETYKEKMEFCKDVKRDLENLVLNAFNFHGESGELFEYMVQCPKCPQQVPFQNAMKHNLLGLLRVKDFETRKKMCCATCDNVITRKEALEHWFHASVHEDIHVNLAHEIKRNPGPLADELGIDETVQKHWFHASAQEDLLADLADEIKCNPGPFADELGVDETVQKTITSQYQYPHTNLVFHILYEWASKKESLVELRNAIGKTKCMSCETFDRIVNRIETEETNQKINECMEKIDKNKFESGYQWNKVVNKMVECIGEEFWILGIRLGIEEETMQAMAKKHEKDIDEHIRNYLIEWRKRDKGGLCDLIKALVKSSPKIDAITTAIVEIYST